MEKIILNIPINRKMLEIIYPIIERILLLSLSFTKLITGNMKQIKTPKIPLNIWMKIVWTILSLAKHAIKLQINKHKQVVGISYFAGK